MFKWSTWIKGRNRDSRAINTCSLLLYTKIKTWHIKVNSIQYCCYWIFKKFQHSRGHRDQALRTSSLLRFFKFVLKMSFFKPALRRDVKTVFSQMPKALHTSGDNKHIIKEERNAVIIQALESIHSAFNTWCKCMKGELTNHDWMV